MAKHRIFKIEDLSTEVLSKIHSDDKLTLCPVCSTALRDACSQNVNFLNDWSSRGSSDHMACHNCRIIWKYKRTPWVEERGDGMITGSGFHINLIAISDCCHAERMIELLKKKDGFTQWWPQRPGKY